ncbi:MAG: hypothetical protein BWY94_02508 [Actinobacteria bacterium ADurb.BinA094]|nr:MAG: hypothetical protein BWY94_02508 [Actinobacteria bacterium ADurb.BinA094]
MERSSRATNAPSAWTPIFPEALSPQSGAATLRVKTAWNGVVKKSAPSRKKGRFSG